jgi:hypothetical protein
VRKILSASPLAVCALGALALFGCSSGLVQSAVDQPTTPTQSATAYQNGLVQDWSTHSAVFPRVGPVSALTQVQNDPRAILAWQQQALQIQFARTPVRYLNVVQRQVHRDWSISLGGGGVAPSMYPAKFTFDVTASPTCIITTAGATPPPPDFAVFPVNIAASSSQPNIVAFEDLYSGSTPTNGVCNTQRPSYFTGDTTTSAATFWSYAITAADGVVATSPALSLDGTKVAFVEEGSGSSAHFHVLGWNGGTTTTAGDGVVTTNSQNALQPKVITSGFSSTSPAANSGAVTDLTLTAVGIPVTQSDTLSSPFIDYTNDRAYVGNDGGTLFRIKNVFCTAAACTGGGSPAPSLDTSWGAGHGEISVCTGELTGPVVDSATGNVFVGCSDGKLYGFTSAGVALAGSPVTVGPGSGTTGGAIVDPPLVDAVNKFVYAVAGASGTTGPEVVVQASSVNLGSVVTATLGSGEQFNMHEPSFNAAYFGVIAGTPLLYEWGLNSADDEIELWGITFGAGMAMTSGPAADGFPVGSSVPVELSPTTEFYNGTTTTDALFVGGLVNATPNFLEANITSGFPGGFSADTGAGSGTSGIIVDNQSSDSQASSIYFGELGAGTTNAVKLTQSGLN